jgi:two-component system, OmpR family, sensor kinase
VKIQSLRFQMTAWYASLLTCALILFGGAIYFGLQQYLVRGLMKSLSEEGQSLGERIDHDAPRGKAHLATEINEQYAPKINDLFIRITAQDGTVMYESDRPESGTLDRYKIRPAQPTGSEYFKRERLPEGGRLLINVQPHVDLSGKNFLIECGTPYRQVRDVLSGLLLILACGTPLIVAGAIWGGYALTRRALTPLNDLAQQAEQISARNLAQRLPVVRTGDEVEQLAISINKMIARLDEAFQHINRFSSDVSHELRTPLTVLRGELEAAARSKVLPSEFRDTVTSALEETVYLGDIVENLLAISRLDGGAANIDTELLDLGDLAFSTTDQMRLLADVKSISIRYEITRGVEVEGNRTYLKQVIVSLLDNAIKYTSPGGWVRVKVWSEEQLAVMEFADNGSGIPAEGLPHIFERFYRADKARSRKTGGHGLGLSIAMAICVAHEGTIKASSVESHGSSFRVELPLAKHHSATIKAAKLQMPNEVSVPDSPEKASGRQL